MKEKEQNDEKTETNSIFNICVLLFIIILILIYMLTPLSKVNSVKIAGNDMFKSTIDKAINVKAVHECVYSTTKAKTI